MSGQLTTTTKKESCMNTFPGHELSVFEHVLLG